MSGIGARIELVQNNSRQDEQNRIRITRLAVLALALGVVFAALSSQSETAPTIAGAQHDSGETRTASLLVPKRVRLIIGYQRTALV